MKSTITIITVFLLHITQLCAQDLTNIKKQKPVKLSGGIGAGSNYYASNEAIASRDPFNWNINGNVTANIYGLTLPFSFVISQYSKSYTTPFAQFGVSPTYKWATLHLGYRNISINPYTFDGQSFLGGGIELRPGKFKFSGFYGRLNKAISEDTTYDHRIEPQYSRTGYAIKLGYGKDGKEISMSFFHAKDKESSIPIIKDSLNNLRPQENSAIGTQWAYTFFKKLSFTGNAALSVLNRDMAYENLDSLGHYPVPRFVRSVSPINYSSVLSYAGSTQLALNLHNFNVSLGYQRIQPDYMSLGTPYSINDVETYSANISSNLAKGKLNLNGSFNTQHNNLANALATELETMAGNFSVNTIFNKNFTANININAANVMQKDGLLKLNDSLRMNQLMLNYSFAPAYNIFSETKQHSLSATVNYTNLKDRNPVTSAYAAGNNFNVGTNYDLQFLKKFIGINVGVNYSVYGQKEFRYQSTGITLGGNAQFLKEHQLSVQGNVGYFFNKSSGDMAGNNISFSLNSGYQKGKSSFSIFGSYILTPPINLNPLDKINQVPIAVTTKNFSAGIQYGYQF